jgi:catechol 2,3-dioxygenase-like lactoylglutathione lyase family enzyme
MFTHVMVGSNDIPRSRTFFDAVLGALGHKRNPARDMPLIYVAEGGGMLMVRTPINGVNATYANGGTIGLQAPSRKAVDEFHKAALANGGKCEGPPGPRPFAPNAYAAYIRDPDGNKFGAFCYAPE